MWEVVKKLKKRGVTIILTTHYIEEAEAIADRVGIINYGKIIIVDEKDKLINRLGQKILRIELNEVLECIPQSLKKFNLKIDESKKILIYKYDTKGKNTGITSLLSEIKNQGITLKDLNTEKSTLEEIFINLVKGSNNEFVRT